MINKVMLRLSIFLLFWLACVEPTIDAIWHIADYTDIIPTLVNKGTIAYLGVMIYGIYFSKQKLINKLSFTIAPVLCFCWASFFAWDMSDFVKHPNWGYFVFMFSPPILAFYNLYWIICSAMSVFNSNVENIDLVDFYKGK